MWVLFFWLLISCTNPGKNEKIITVESKDDLKLKMILIFFWLKLDF